MTLRLEGSMGRARFGIGSGRDACHQEQLTPISVKPIMNKIFPASLGFTFLASVVVAGTVEVPGKANPWLAGMTNGATGRRGDSAPEQSPVPVTGMTIEGGATYMFSASGSANHGSTLPFFPPDGEDLISHYLGAENGIADITAPFVSLIGVFLGPNSPDQDPAPRPLDFRNQADRDYLALAPALKQPFFIGDGVTSSGDPQQVLAPAGATRLFLGIMDQYNWSDNEGSFTVQVARVASSAAVRLSLRPAPNPTAEDAAAVPIAAPGVTAAISAPQLHAYTAIEIVWPSETNHFYQVQWALSLDAQQWSNVGPIMSGSGADLSFFDSTRTHPKGFYRVQVLQRAW